MKIRIGRKKNNRYEAFISEGVHYVTIPGVMRIHMRRDKNGNNMVWINGIDLLLVNKVAADFIDVFIRKVWESNSLGTASPEMIEKAVVKEMKKIYPGIPEDLAVTYKCDNNCYFCYAGGSRNVKELSTDQWKKVLTIYGKLEFLK